MSRHATSDRGIVRDRESDIEYGHYVGPPFRPYEREAIKRGHTDIPVEEWDRLATDNPVSLRFRNKNHGGEGSTPFRVIPRRHGAPVRSRGHL